MWGSDVFYAGARPENGEKTSELGKNYLFRCNGEGMKVGQGR